jgi:glycosyltransferase involved in cell wall biosynthesis
MRVLHITAHLGGGIGKVLSRLAAESARRRDGVRHVIASLEVPEKQQFVDHLQSHGGALVVAPSSHQLAEEIQRADIVQVEWWHHPIVAGWLCAGELPAMRLIVWSHVSGLHAPEIPPAFVAAPHRFLFTSPCSLEHPQVSALRFALGKRMGVVFSAGGFEDLPVSIDRPPRHGVRAGYVGTLNFAKLHPHILEFVAAVRAPGFRLALVGDPTTGSRLLEQASAQGIADRLDFRGYRPDVAKELAGFDVFAYLLNPLHYGTTENALLEAMAMGVVPVVLNNPAERHLIAHMKTGLVVKGAAEFADAIDWLEAHPAEWARLSSTASQTVRARFSAARTTEGLNGHYRSVLEEDKRPFDFRPIFGAEPADWFRSCQGTESWRFDAGGGALSSARRGPEFLYEKTKGSVFHYRNVYPTDVRLTRWAQELEAVA